METIAADTACGRARHPLSFELSGRVVRKFTRRFDFDDDLGALADAADPSDS
jgi:hypothetical protein